MDPKSGEVADDGEHIWEQHYYADGAGRVLRIVVDLNTGDTQCWGTGHMKGQVGLPDGSAAPVQFSGEFEIVEARKVGNGDTSDDPLPSQIALRELAKAAYAHYAAAFETAKPKLEAEMKQQVMDQMRARGGGLIQRANSVPKIAIP